MRSSLGPVGLVPLAALLFGTALPGTTFGQAPPEGCDRSKSELGRPAATPDCEPMAEDEEFLRLRWWHPLAAGAGIATLFLVDEPIQEFMQDNQSGFQDDVADVVEEFHEPNVFLVASAGSMALGLVAREPAISEFGVQAAAAYGLSSGMMIATKWLFGRARPSLTPDDVTNFDWTDGGSTTSFPSGASAVSFSLATTLADAVDRTPVTVAAYSLATLNSWSRVYTDRHWFSDVALGALYGITAAKIANGRWRLFGWRPPTVGIAADGGVRLTYAFPP